MNEWSSLILQARVVYDLVKLLNWTNVEILTTRGSAYSKSLKEKFEKIAQDDTDPDHGVYICKTEE